MWLALDDLLFFVHGQSRQATLCKHILCLPQLGERACLFRRWVPVLDWIGCMRKGVLLSGTFFLCMGGMLIKMVPGPQHTQRALLLVFLNESLHVILLCGDENVAQDLLGSGFGSVL